MSEKLDMKLALNLAIQVLRHPNANWDGKYLIKAADMLRDGGKPMEVSKEMKRIKCQHCGFIQNDSWTYCKSCRELMYGIYGKPHKVVTLKKHSEFQRIKIETIKTAPVEEEITDEVDK